MTTPIEKSYDEQLADIPANARVVVAQARNHRILMQQHHDRWTEESRIVKTAIRQLKHKYGLNPYKIAGLMGMSRNRIIHIIEEQTKGRKP